MTHNAKISTDDTSNNLIIHCMVINGMEVSYPSVVGSLMYTMVGTHPDIAFLVGVLSRYLAKPKKCHWEMVK
jgi:hypothetical protein